MTDPFNNFTAQPVVQSAQVETSNKKATTIGDSLAATSVDTGKDTVELTSKKEKKGPVKTVNNAIAGIKKFFASAKTYCGGTIKGLAKGAAVGSVIYTAASAINHFRANAEKKIPGKVLGIGAAVVTLGSTLWKSSLNLNEQKSGIEHRYQGHKQ